MNGLKFITGPSRIRPAFIYGIKSIYGGMLKSINPNPDVGHVFVVAVDLIGPGNPHRWIATDGDEWLPIWPCVEDGEMIFMVSGTWPDCLRLTIEDQKKIKPFITLYVEKEIGDK